tara:strand:- start:14 stop:1519 length:1506 start_codon:yes stop_codon:yes gene_type:complete
MEKSLDKIDKGVQTENTIMDDISKLNTIEKLLATMNVIISGEEIIDEKIFQTIIHESLNIQSVDDDSSSDEESDEAEESDEERLTEDDVSELLITINELIDEHLERNIVDLRKPEFQEELIHNIANFIYFEVLNVKESEENIKENEYYNEIHNLVEEEYQLYLQYNNIPKRSNSITLEELENYTEEEIKEIEYQLEKLDNIPQPIQRTKEWFEFRYNLITASNLWKVFGSQCQVNSLIFEKCKPLEYIYNNASINSPLHWGVKYEPVTVMIYEDIYKTKVKDYGCIKHEKYSYIGASPDGINVDKLSSRYGRMLEIKNIYNREITGIPKMEYWVQTQIQMETCELDKCDFVETRIKEYETSEEFYDDEYRDNESSYKGVILYFIEKTIIEVYNQPPKYEYMPLTISLDKNEILKWIDEKTKENDNYKIHKLIYWKLDEISCVVINRNKKWLDKAIPQIKKTWDLIEKERVEGYEHRRAKKRTTISATDPHQKCLIKLDSEK